MHGPDETSMSLGRRPGQILRASTGHSGTFLKVVQQLHTSKTAVSGRQTGWRDRRLQSKLALGVQCSRFVIVHSTL